MLYKDEEMIMLRLYNSVSGYSMIGDYIYKFEGKLLLKRKAA